jgi:UDP-N-acetyl-D-galactosamine dehydrogenase
MFDRRESMTEHSTRKLAIIGLGYVGLPLAVEFGKTRPVVGFDIASRRIAELRSGVDHTLEVPVEELREATQLWFTDDANELASCDVYIVTVPTPIDQFKRPDLRPLLNASKMIGRVLAPGDLVIYESTVYPGATEEDCVPVLEAESGLIFNRDFFVGYSPERINPGDRQHRLPTITKVTSGSTPAAADLVNALYSSIITAGTHKAASIKVAEAAKVIENTQRDLNIALVNELALIFDKMDIDTLEVLEAAGTKWNFLPFRPGLVGGHCISVDPYYLTHKAQQLGYFPEVVLAGRRINDGMGEHVANRLIRSMIKAAKPIKGARVLILGLTFKENCPDLRNTRVTDIVTELEELGISVSVHDPYASAAEAEAEYGIALVETEPDAFDGIVIAVAHDLYREWGLDKITAFGREGAVIFDLKGLFPAEARLMRL